MTVFQQQCLLAYLGYDPGPIDGVNGPRTAGAMERFRQDWGEKTLQSAVAAEPKDFWDTVRWFTREEFRCKCGGAYCGGFPAEMQEGVVRIADAAREHFGRPAHVVSGLRCRKWNELQGGVGNSQHMYGEAIDLKIDGVSAGELQSFVSQQPGHRYSYCINDTNVHFDIPAGVRP